MTSPIFGSVRKLTGKNFKAMILGLFLGLNVAEARVFSFKNDGFVPYFKGGYNPTERQNTLLSESSSVPSIELDYQDAFTSDQSIEFGFGWAGPKTTLRFGLEIVRPVPIENQTAKSTAAGLDLYSYTSEASAVIPKVVIEGHLYYFSISRFNLFLGAGYADLVARNSYVFLADGISQYGVADFAEDLRGKATSLEAGVSWECLLADTTTFQLDAGYRSLEFTEVTYGKDVTNFQGTYAKDSVALNSDGTKRTLDLSGPFVNLALKFYIF